MCPLSSCWWWNQSLSTKVHTSSSIYITYNPRRGDWWFAGDLVHALLWCVGIEISKLSSRGYFKHFCKPFDAYRFFIHHFSWISGSYLESSSNLPGIWLTTFSSTASRSIYTRQSIPPCLFIYILQFQLHSVLEMCMWRATSVSTHLSRENTQTSRYLDRQLLLLQSPRSQKETSTYA